MTNQFFKGLFLVIVIFWLTGCGGGGSERSPTAANHPEPGAISGQVRSREGYPVAEASVAVSPHPITGESAPPRDGLSTTVATDQAGKYTVGNLVPDTYDLTVSRDDFISQTRQVRVEAGRTSQVNIMLAPADENESDTLTEEDEITPGGWIAFVSRDMLQDQDQDIWIMTAAGAARTNLTKTNSLWDTGFIDDGKLGAPKLEGAPSFSPDGTKIAFETYRNGNYDIYVRSLRGGKPTHLTDEDSEDRYPDWSPDGNSVVYSSNRDGIGFKLYLMGLDGEAPTQLTDSSKRADIYPAFSPDGTKIAFEGVTFPKKSEIYVLDTTDTGTVITLTSGGDNHTPNWSPDGRMIAYQSKGDIFLTMADGSNFPDGQKEISLTDTRDNYFPVFSPQVEKKTISGGTVIKNFYMAFSSYQWGRNEDILLLNMEERSDTANNWFIKSRVVSNLTESRDYESDPDWQ